MKLGTLKNDTRDGALVVVSKNLKHAVVAYEAAPTLQSALDDWGYIAAQLKQLYDDLNRAPGPRAFELDPRQLAAPLPRAYQWLDASAYLPHVELVRAGRRCPRSSGRTPSCTRAIRIISSGPATRSRRRAKTGASISRRRSPCFSAMCRWA